MDLKNNINKSPQYTNLNISSANFALNQHSLVSITDLEGKIIHVNQKFCDVSGYSDSELLGKNHNILNSGNQSKAYWKDMYDKVLAGGVWHDEVKNRAKDGSFYWVDTTIVAATDNNNQIVGFTSVRTDITKQKHTIEQLAVANQQTEAAKFALDQHSLVSSTDLAGNITYVNDKFCQVSGYTEQELIGKKHSILNSGNQPKAYWQKMHGTVLSGNVWHDEVKNRAKDGSYYWVDTTIVPNFNSKNEVIGFTSIRTDITKQKEALLETATAQEQEKAAKFALDQHSLVSSADISGTITYVNEKFCSVSGYSKEELIGKKHNLLNSGNQTKAYWQKMHGTVLSGSVWHDEVKNRAKDGSYYWVDTTIVPSFNNKKEVIGFTSIRTDITQQKNNIEQLQVAKKQAELAKEVKEDFLANMSHEIRTPMNGVYASLQLLSRHNMPFEQRELVNQTLFSCECLLTIVNDVLDFSKIDSGKLELENISFSIRNTVESVISDILPIVNSDKVKLVYPQTDVVWDFWVGDPVRTKQILLNLLSNAVKFTEEGQITISLSQPQDEHISGLIIEIGDSGIGMSKETVDNIFNRFTQADSSTTRKYGGTGLGMSITLSLVKMMGGTLKVYSKEGKGTNFTINLPLKKGNKEALFEQKNDHVVCPELSNKIILVADDNRINRTIMKKALAPSKASILEAENGREAFDMAIKYNPDIVLMDIQMPIMDGLSSFRMLKKHQFAAPVVAFTANVLKHDVERYIEEGFVKSLSKPLNINELYKTLVHFLK